MENYIFTSEGVTEGHPDKICDIISDTILTEALQQDINSKMAVEATIKNDFVFIYGEAKTDAKLNYTQIAKYVLQKIGYDEKYRVYEEITEQSKEITDAVMHDDGSIGAGDQGIMFGFTCDDTSEFMPAPIFYANLLASKLDKVRRQFSFLKQVGKTQVSVEYVDGKMYRIDTIVISIQHIKNISYSKIKNTIINEVILSTIPQSLIDKNTKILINPSGSFILGGSFADSGTTGRKIICDTYGGMGRIGGGCLSSKDPSEVDRTAAYYCRYVAKNIVANNLAKKVEIQVSYAIGKENPISFMIDTFGTNTINEKCIYEIIKRNFNFEVKNMINELDLLNFNYIPTACYGHFGNPEYPWERIIDLK